MRPGPRLRALLAWTDRNFPASARWLHYLRWAAAGPEEALLRDAYRTILCRYPDEGGRSTYLPALRSGELSVEKLGEMLLESPEFQVVGLHRGLGPYGIGPYLHRSRRIFMRSLPPARRILDLGGTDLGHEFGALVNMGYPYRFEELVIVDLPPDERHPIYDRGGVRSVVATPLGPVRYAYHSMDDLSDYPEESFDLVVSGQSIEHLPPDAADTMLRGAFRVLRPGGWLAVDTPNARVTRLQQEAFIDPDHKYEYTPEEMEEKLRAAGFEVVERKGLNLANRSLEQKEFDMDEIVVNVGLFADVASCYLMAFVCRRP